MVKRKKTLEILNKERDYEDKIAVDLLFYCEICIDEIDDLDKEEKEEVLRNLLLIKDESIRHGKMINELINFVLEHGEDNY